MLNNHNRGDIISSSVDGRSPNVTAVVMRELASYLSSYEMLRQADKSNVDGDWLADQTRILALDRLKVISDILIPLVSVFSASVTRSLFLKQIPEGELTLNAYGASNYFHEVKNPVTPIGAETFIHAYNAQLIDSTIKAYSSARLGDTVLSHSITINDGEGIVLSRVEEDFPYRLLITFAANKLIFGLLSAKDDGPSSYSILHLPDPKTNTFTNPDASYQPNTIDYSDFEHTKRLPDIHVDGGYELHSGLTSVREFPTSIPVLQEFAARYAIILNDLYRGLKKVT